MIIERFASANILQILEVFNESRLNTEGLPSTMTSVTSLQALTEGECIFVAKLNGKIAGFVSVWPDGNFVHHLYVLPEFQKQGIGNALIEKCRVSFGLPLRLKCGKNNRKARQYYENTGWLKESESIGPDGPYINYRLGDL